MFLRKNISKKTGRTYLSIVQGYRDSNGISRSKTVKSIGYLDELKDNYDDPIAYFTEEVRKMNEHRIDDNSALLFTIEKNELIPTNSVNRKNYGYAALSKIYHELGIHTFIMNRRKPFGSSYDANSIMKMIIFSRVLDLGTKKKYYEHRERYFENTDYTIDDVYDCLKLVSTHREQLHHLIDNKVKLLYPSDSRTFHCHVANFFFEEDHTEALKHGTLSKERRSQQFIHMGLFLDNHTVPITYRLFSGNNNDCLVHQNLSMVKQEYGIERIIFVAERDMASDENIRYILSSGDSYIFCLPHNNIDKELREYMMEETGYEWHGKEYKWKSRLHPRTIMITSPNGIKHKAIIQEKQIIYYSERSHRHAKAERATIIAKAQHIVDDHIKNTHTDMSGTSDNMLKSGHNIHTTEASEHPIDWRRFQEEDALDGYLVITTSECNENSDRIIEQLRALWRTEDAFHVMKSDLESHYLNISRQDYIQIHFLNCYVALVLTRILELKLGQRHSITRILESLNKAECSFLQQNYYLFDYYDNVLQDIGDMLGIDFSKRIRSLKEIKKSLGPTKNNE